MFKDDTPSTKTPSIKTQSRATLKKTITQVAQTEGIGIVAATQTELFIEVLETYDYCVSRMDPNHCSQEEFIAIVKPPTVSNTQRKQLDDSHNIITKGIITKLDHGQL